MRQPGKPFLPAMLLLTGAVALCLGCATQQPYQLGRRAAYYQSRGLAAQQDQLQPADQIQPTLQIERGERRPVLDAAGWVLGIPGKIVLWNSKVDNHRISPETEAALAEYLAANELTDVKVRLNQYAPVDEWRRLTRNDAVAAPWRYTLGTLSVAKEAILPGRLFGGSNYNPYTNSIHLYDDVPALALHEGAHAKDWASRRYKGTYAALYLLPGAPLYHEAIATRDALGYAREFGDYHLEREAYNTLYPAYGTYVGGALGDVFIAPASVAYGLSVIGGHAVGRWNASQVPDFNRHSEPLESATAHNEDHDPSPVVPVGLLREE